MSKQFSSVVQLCPTLSNPMNCSTPPCPSPTPRVYHAEDMWSSTCATSFGPHGSLLSYRLLSCHSNTLATWCKQLIIGNNTEAGKDWRQEKKGTIRGWGGWMASPTRWTWVWASFGSWWWTGKPIKRPRKVMRNIDKMSICVVKIRI